MPLIAQRVPSLLGGVSQLPPARRDASQLEAQINGLSHPVLGLLKRPPTKHIDVLTASVTNVNDAYVLPVEADTHRFIIIVRNGDIAVYDRLTGDSVPVDTPNGTTYLNKEAAASTSISVDGFSGTNGTNLSTHLSALTVGYVKLAGTVDGFQIQGNRLEGQYAKDCVYMLDFPVPSANYTVSARVGNKSPTFIANNIFMLRARGNLNDQVCYAARLVYDTNASVQIMLLGPSGGQTSLTGPVNTGIDMRTTPLDLALRVTDNFIEVLVNDVVLVSVTDTTLPDAGYFGLSNFGDSTFDRQITVDDLNLRYTPPAEATGQSPFRAVQIGGTTVILNTTVTTRKGETGSPERVHEALVSIQQADYGTQYVLTIDDEELAHGSPEGITPNARFEIDTTFIAGRIATLIESADALVGFEVTQYGSTLHITRTDGADFTIAGDDGLADNGLVVIKGSVQRFTDLPDKARDGMVMEITGDPASKFDNYFVKFDVADTATNVGVWRECVKPGETIRLDASVMPHVLEYNGTYLKSEAVESPPAPRISTGGGTPVINPWDGPSFLTQRVHLNDNGDHPNVTLADANGIETEYEVFYSVTTIRADPANPATVELQKEVGGNGADVWETVDSATYGPEVALSNQRLSARLTMVANERLRFILHYADDVTPADGMRADFYTNAASNTLYPSVRYTPHTGKTVIYEPQRVYPQGVDYNVVVDATTFTYTPTSDKTGTQIAVALKSLVDANASYTATNPEDGVILIVKDAGGVATVTADIEFDPATMMHNPDLALSTDALAGKTLKNLTDGSAGTITANTGTTVTVATLSSGAGNTFADGDKVEAVSLDQPYFVFRQGEWVDRETGDIDSNPMPSFIDKKLSEVLYHRGRLGLVAEDSVTLSTTANPFNLFRTTVTQLLDGDPISVRPANGKSVRFHGAAEWNDLLVLFSGRHQYALTGDPLLTPTTVQLKLLSEYASSPVARPVVLGRRIYFASQHGDFSKVFSYEVMENQPQPQALSLTGVVPRYIPGDPLQVVGDETAGILMLMTDSQRDTLFVFSFDRERQWGVWSQWTFPTGSTIMGFDILEGEITFVIAHSDGVFLETLNLEVE